MTKLNELPRKAPKILLWGAVGSGKTALALTLGRHAQVIDCDNGLLTGLTLRDAFADARGAVDVRQCVGDGAFAKAKSYVDEVVKQVSARTWPFRALVVDSLTRLMDGALAQAAGNQGSTLKRIEIQHYGMAFTEVEALLQRLTALDIVVVLIAHQQTKTIDEVDRLELAVVGKNMPTRVPQYFDEVWYSRVAAAAQGRMSYTLQTRSTVAIATRSRSNLADGTSHDVGLVGILKLMGYDIEAAATASTPSVSAPTPTVQGART